MLVLCTYMYVYDNSTVCKYYIICHALWYAYTCTNTPGMTMCVCTSV